MPHGKHGALRMFSSRFLWGKHGGQGKLEKSSWEANLSASWLLPPPPPQLIFAKAFAILCVDDSWLSGGGRQGSSSVLQGGIAMCIQSPGNTPSPDHKGRPVPREVKRWTFEVDRIAGPGQGSWVGPGEQDTEELGRLHHSWQEAGSTELLFAGRVWGTAVGLLCGMETYPA